MSQPAQGRDIKPATGKLGVLLPGMGAVATTFVAGVEAARRKLALALSTPSKSRMSVPFGDASDVQMMSLARSWRARATPVRAGKSFVKSRRDSLVSGFIESND